MKRGGQISRLLQYGHEVGKGRQPQPDFLGHLLADLVCRRLGAFTVGEPHMIGLGLNQQAGPIHKE